MQSRRSMSVSAKPEKRVLFLGAKKVGYACLEYLLQHRVELGIDLIGVLTNDNVKVDAGHSVSQLASSHGIPVIPGLARLTEAHRCEVLISVQYHEILRRKHIDLATEIAVNLHMAPLPEYRGCNQFSFAILNGDSVFGTTLHRLEEGVDSGDILAEKRFPIPEQIRVSELFNLTSIHSIALFEEQIASIIAGEYRLIPQDELIPSRGCSVHYRREIEQLKQIDPSWSLERIKRSIRATSMPGYEPPYAVVDGEKFHYELDQNGTLTVEGDAHHPLLQHAVNPAK